MGKKIIDLHMDNDGTYAPVKRNVPNKKRGGIVKRTEESKPRYILHDDATDFLNGIDAGLDFIENVVPRIDRFLKLRG